MDIICPRCGEPWSMDCLHDVPGMSFARAWRMFQREGCAIFDTTCGVPNTRAARAARTIYRMAGGDPDGCAAMLDEYTWLSQE